MKWLPVMHSVLLLQWGSLAPTGCTYTSRTPVYPHCLQKCSAVLHVWVVPSPLGSWKCRQVQNKTQLQTISPHTIWEYCLPSFTFNNTVPLFLISDCMSIYNMLARSSVGVCFRNFMQHTHSWRRPWVSQSIEDIVFDVHTNEYMYIYLTIQFMRNILQRRKRCGFHQILLETSITR